MNRDQHFASEAQHVAPPAEFVDAVMTKLMGVFTSGGVSVMQPVMQFSSDGRTYRLAFKHVIFDKPVPGTISPEHERTIIGRTSCLIKTWLTGDDPKTATVIGQGVAECSALDRYDKEIGRQKALRRALKATWPPSHLWELAFKAYADRKR